MFQTPTHMLKLRIYSMYIVKVLQKGSLIYFSIFNFYQILTRLNGQWMFDIMHGGAQFVENYGQNLWVKFWGTIASMKLPKA